MPEETSVPLKILQRYIIDQVLRSFVLALITLTSVIILFMVMAEATNKGMAPQDVARIIPFIIPGTLVYTIPVALLFAVSVVYGRLASDNEIIAMKSAGLSALVALKPSIYLSLALSVVMCLLSFEIIPRANHAFKSGLFKNMEDTLYMFLKKDREINNPKWPFFIGVKDVQGRLLLGATFKHRQAGAPNPNTFDLTVQAKTAVLHFNVKRDLIEVTLDNADIQGPNMYSHLPHHVLEYKLPTGDLTSYEKKIQEMTAQELARELAKVNRQLSEERQRQAVAAALWIASGRLNRVDWPHFGAAYRDYARWERQLSELETEKQLRLSMATGSFFFVLLGAPVGVLFARGDFLSAFITCFLPIIIMYYPITLASVNLGKEGTVPPYIVWAGNALLGVLAGAFAWKPVMKH
jgi:lipopolysaccharide export system permease protein